jgi:hypothetical protein
VVELLAHSLKSSCRRSPLYQRPLLIARRTNFGINYDNAPTNNVVSDGILTREV